MEDTMTKIKKQISFNCAIVLLSIVFNFKLYSLVCFNGAGSGYEGVGKSITTNSIEVYIIDGAGFYLAAKTDIDKLLRSIELQDSQGLDFKVLNVVVDSAIANMKAAFGIYETLILEASNTPYNVEVQFRLKTFDYTSFMLSNGLNKSTFNAVSGFLKYGDITGCFKRTQSDMKNILAMLQIIKESTTLNRLPDISIIWRLNESCSELSLFGSYVARVFSAI